MTQEKEGQLQFVKDMFVELVDKKFRQGDAEHAEDIMNLDLVGEAVMEIIDACVYLFLMLKKRKDGVAPRLVCHTCREAKEMNFEPIAGQHHHPDCPMYAPLS